MTRCEPSIVITWAKKRLKEAKRDILPNSSNGLNFVVVHNSQIVN